MNRLTKYDDRGPYIDDQSVYYDQKRRGKEITLLAAYEDTGLRPEEIPTGVEMAQIACALQELKKYRGVIPPIKIGDTLWSVDWDGRIINGRVSMLQQKSDGTWRFRVSGEYHADLPLDQLGKSAFLSYEEAMTVLKNTTRKDVNDCLNQSC